MILAAIDPGTTHSAYVLIDTDTFVIIDSGLDENSKVKEWLASCQADHLVIEMLKSYGNVMGDSCLITCVWVGRFIEAWPGTYTTMPRKTIVTELCRNPRAKDSNVRQALIDFYAEQFNLPEGTDKVVVGRKASPGPLYGVKKDIWAALAVAVVWTEVFEGEEYTFEELCN